jgi:hypothetical protein
MSPFDRLSCLPMAVARVKRCVLFATRPQVIWEGCVRVLTVPCVWDAGTEHEAVGTHTYQHVAPSVPADYVGRILPEHQGECWALHLVVVCYYNYYCVICRHNHCQRHLKVRSHYRFVFKRCSVWISARALAIITEVLNGFPQSLQAHARVLPWLDYNHSLPNSGWFSIHLPSCHLMLHSLAADSVVK